MSCAYLQVSCRWSSESHSGTLQIEHSMEHFPLLAFHSCMNCFGTYINHVESIEESTLACNWTLTGVNYDMSTKQVWNNGSGIPINMCK